MPQVSPIDALVYDTAVAGPLDRLTAPPYDVISESRRRSYLDGSAHNIVHLDLAEGSDDPSAPDSRYAGAAELLAEWRARGILRPTGSAYFAYETRFALDGHDRILRGVFCALELEPWGGSVLPHEETMDGPIEDRLQLLRATRTHLSAIYGTVSGPSRPLAELLGSVASKTPMSFVRDREGVEHRLWRLEPSEPVRAWLADEPLLIADGHHRFATALAYRDERRRDDGPGPGTGS